MSIFAENKNKIMGLFGLFSNKKKETLDKGLEKTKESVFGKLARAVAGKSTVDDDVLDDLEEVLITSDVGVETTVKIIRRIEERVARDKYVSTSELNRILREEIAILLSENHSDDLADWELPADHKPYVILVVGVNGVGKTTTIGKLAYQLRSWQEGCSGSCRHLPCRCRRADLHLGRARGRACSETADGKRPGKRGVRHPAERQRQTAPTWCSSIRQADCTTR